MRQIIFFLLLFSTPAFAQNSDIFRIDSLPTEGVLLNKGWKWHAGDNPDFAKTDFDDLPWEGIDPTLTIPKLKQIDTKKPLWLRLKLSGQKPQSATFSVKHSGASEIFLNGKLIKSYGVIENKDTKTMAYNPLNEQVILNLDSNINTIAIRYYFQKDLKYEAMFGETFPLFSAQLNANTFQVSVAEKYVWEGFNIGVPFILFIVHLIFFLYYTPAKTNLWYSLSSFFGFLGNYLLFKMRVSHGIEDKNTLINYAVVLSIFNIIFLFYTIYIFLKQKNKWLIIIFISLSFISLFNQFLGFIELGPLVTFVYLAFVIYMSIQANRQGIQGAKAIIVGLVFYAIFWALFLLSFQWQALHSSSDILFHLATLTLPIVISTLLGLEFKNTNITLIKNLEEINSLSIEKQQILFSQNETLEKQVQERTAELQLKNRDLEIETALERIRSRSIAMQQSDELSGVIKVIFEQFQSLGFNIQQAGFTTNIHEMDWDLWLAIPNYVYPNKVILPYFDHPLFTRGREILANNQDFIADVLSFEETNDWFQHMFKTPFFSKIPEKTKEYLLNIKGMARSAVNTKNIALTIFNYDATPYSPEENLILRRFAHAFEQSYNRFLDLQKAEAQVREGEIEIALERVRSKTMAMHSSDDVTAAIATMFTELEKLGVENLRCGTANINPNKTMGIWSVSNVENLKSAKGAGIFDMNAHILWQ